MNNCLTCKWEPKWRRNKNFPGVKIGNCDIPVPAWVYEGFRVTTGLYCDADNFRTMSKDKDGTVCASLGDGIETCPTWQAKEAD